jgi:hypothetical protein
MKPLRTLLLFLCMVSLSHAADLTTLDGKKAKGEIVAIEGTELVFKTNAGQEKHELTKLATVEFGMVKQPAADPKLILVEMIDGSHFICADFKIKGKTAFLTLAGSKLAIEAPIATVLYMIRDISDPKLNQTFRGFLSKRDKDKRDSWIVLQGEAEKTLDKVPGTFGDGDAAGEVIQFEIAANNEKVKIDLGRVYGMILKPVADVVVAQTLCRIVDVQGNIIFAKSLAIAGKKVAIETILDVKIEYPSLESIATLDFAAGALSYLSNINPIKVEMSSTEGTAEPYRRDRNLDNESLKIADQKFDKGLALHSRTVLTYDLGGKYKRFEAVAGVDDCVEGESKVKLTIEADLKPIFTGVVKKGDKPKVLNLGVLNVKELRITVESDFLDLGNQVDLADAKVRK